MGKVIAIVNQKGGVAKTTTTATLAWGLASAGKSVLVCDCDPQGNLSQSMGAKLAKDSLTIYEWLGCSAVPISFEKVVQHIGAIDIVPATIKLSKAEIALTQVLNRETVLSKALKQIKARYDYVLLDSPPSLGLLTINILTAADEVLIPSKPEYLSFEGVEMLIDTIKDIKENCNAKLKINGFLITMYDKRREVSDWVDMLGDLAAATHSVLYAARVRNTAAIANAPAFATSVFEYAATSIGAQDYKEFLTEFLEREQHEQDGQKQNEQTA